MILNYTIIDPIVVEPYPTGSSAVFITKLPAVAPTLGDLFLVGDSTPDTRLVPFKQQILRYDGNLTFTRLTHQLLATVSLSGVGYTYYSSPGWTRTELVESSGGGGGGSDLTPTQIEGAINSALTSQNFADFETRTVRDANGAVVIIRDLYDSITGTFSSTTLNLDGTEFTGTLVAPIEPVASSEVTLDSKTFEATTNGAGFDNNDTLERVRIYNGQGGVISDVWYNITSGLSIADPGAGNYRSNEANLESTVGSISNSITTIESSISIIEELTEEFTSTTTLSGNLAAGQELAIAGLSAPGKARVTIQNKSTGGLLYVKPDTDVGDAITTLNSFTVTPYSTATLDNLVGRLPFKILADTASSIDYLIIREDIQWV